MLPAGLRLISSVSNMISQPSTRYFIKVPICQINKYPWMVSLVSSGGGHFCGGTLVASRYVVTAAHCLEGSLPSELAVVLGEHDTTVTGEGSIGELSLAVAAIFSHENYDSFTLDNDISVLELAEEVDINTYTPACMAQVWSFVLLVHY